MVSIKMMVPSARLTLAGKLLNPYEHIFHIEALEQKRHIIG